MEFEFLTHSWEAWAGPWIQTRWSDGPHLLTERFVHWFFPPSRISLLPSRKENFDRKKAGWGNPWAYRMQPNVNFYSRNGKKVAFFMDEGRCPTCPKGTFDKLHCAQWILSLDEFYRFRIKGRNLFYIKRWKKWWKSLVRMWSTSVLFSFFLVVVKRELSSRNGNEISYFPRVFFFLAKRTLSALWWVVGWLSFQLSPVEMEDSSYSFDVKESSMVGPYW